MSHSRIKSVKRIKTDIEKQIITGLIIDDNFCNEVLPITKFIFFKLTYAKTILKWLNKYFEEYQKAPKQDIQTIYDVEKEYIDPSDKKIIKTFLINLSSEYETTNYNSQYQIQVARDYYKKRNLELFFENGQKLITSGKIDDAENLFENYNQVSVNISDRFNPFDDHEIDIHNMEKEGNKLFRFEGAIGDLFDYFERGWLVAITGTEKKGKSWWMQEVVFQALMSGLKVLWFNLEMNKTQIKERFYQRFTGLNDEAINEIIFPVFDCFNNQDGSCKKKIRTNRINNLLDGFSDDEGDEDDILSLFETNTKYKPCIECRGTKDFIPRYWFQKQQNIKKRNNVILKKKRDHFKMMFSTNLRVKVYPAFSANSMDIKREIDDLERTENFIPDVITHDYIDIQGDDSKVMNDRDKINKKWQQAKNIAATKQCCFFTADQADAAAREQKSLKQRNFTDDKRKDGHLDMRIGLNQTDDEKEHQIMRLNILYHRHKNFFINQEVMALQALKIGQTLLDSEFISK